MGRCVLSVGGGKDFLHFSKTRGNNERYNGFILSIRGRGTGVFHVGLLGVGTEIVTQT